MLVDGMLFFIFILMDLEGMCKIVIYCIYCVVVLVYFGCDEVFGSFVIFMQYRLGFKFGNIGEVVVFDELFVIKIFVGFYLIS